MKYRKYKRNFNTIIFRGSEHNPPYSITSHTALGRQFLYFHYMPVEEKIGDGEHAFMFIQPNLTPSIEKGERPKFKYYCSSTNAQYMEGYWGWLADIQDHIWTFMSKKRNVPSCWWTWAQIHWEQKLGIGYKEILSRKGKSWPMLHQITRIRSTCNFGMPETRHNAQELITVYTSFKELLTQTEPLPKTLAIAFCWSTRPHSQTGLVFHF